MKPSSWARTANTKSLSWTGQELAAGLGAVGEARAEQPARADRDLRLEHLPAGALRVGGGLRNEVSRSFW